MKNIGLKIVLIYLLPIILIFSFLHIKSNHRLVTSDVSMDNVQDSTNTQSADLSVTMDEEEEQSTATSSVVSLPPLYIKQKVETISVGIFTVFAYNSVVGQTDSTPCISADNKNICDRYYEGNKNLCASNDFNLGSKIVIDGIGECLIVDRMNKRYSNTVDIYLGYDVTAARKFGRKKLEIFLQN